MKEIQAKELVLLSDPRPKVRVISFNRPEKRNALSQELIDDFLGALRSAAADEEVSVVVITGSTACFSCM